MDNGARRSANRITVDLRHDNAASAGLGKFLIGRLLEEADTAGKLLTLSSAKINPARRLYDRLGFVAVHESEFKVYMERWQPKSPNGPKSAMP